jgi:hypothetical protein
VLLWGFSMQSYRYILFNCKSACSHWTWLFGDWAVYSYF